MDQPNAIAQGSYSPLGTASTTSTIEAAGGGLRTQADNFKVGAAADGGGRYVGYGSPFSSNMAMVGKILGDGHGLRGVDG